MTGSTSPATGCGGGRRSGYLQRLAERAGRAAIGPVLKRLPRTPGRLPRIALIPMRELAVVPWHAARLDGPDGGIYAIGRAVFSYALSARLLCEVAARPPVPLDGGGLFVADPDTHGDQPDLAAARSEAWAIRQCYYADAMYVGRLGDGSPKARRAPDARRTSSCG